MFLSMKDLSVLLLLFSLGLANAEDATTNQRTNPSAIITTKSTTSTDDGTSITTNPASTVATKKSTTSTKDASVTSAATTPATSKGAAGSTATTKAMISTNDATFIDVTTTATTSKGDAGTTATTKSVTSTKDATFTSATTTPTTSTGAAGTSATTKSITSTKDATFTSETTTPTTSTSAASTTATTKSITSKQDATFTSATTTPTRSTGAAGTSATTKSITSTQDATFTSAATIRTTSTSTAGTTATTIISTPPTTAPTTLPTTTEDTGFRNVCYPLVGCFDNDPPFDNVQGKVPLSPTEIGGIFWLYTRSSAPNYEELFYADNSSLQNSTFDPSKKTKFVIHGFSSNIEKQYLQDIKNALLDKGDFNVILVGWGKASALPDYGQATANLRLIAKEVTLLIDHMVDAGLDLANIHLIGHSLGAHMAGDIGQLKEGKIGRISGLEPAQPNFENKSTVVRLDSGDAMFVDVLHTDSNKFDLLTGGFGLNQPSGHVDIYANGGQLQPGCPSSASGLWDIISHLNFSSGFGTKLACSHNLAPQYYIESIKQSCTYTSYPCQSYSQFERGECLSCKDGCSSMGYLADTMPGRGIHYLNTMAQRPYCGKAYAMEMTPSDNQVDNNHGTIYMALAGEQGISHFSQITSLKGVLSKKLTIHHIAMFNEVGKPKSVQVKYVRSDAYFVTAKKKFRITNIVLKDINSGIIYQTCGGPYALQTEVAQDIALSEVCGDGVPVVG